MMRRAVVVMVVVMGPAAGVLGALSAERAKEIEELVRQLGVAAHAEREAATKRLIEIGMDAAGMVRKELDRTDDPEVKARCQEVLAKVRLAEERVGFLGRVPAGADPEFSRDGMHMMYVFWEGEKEGVWHDGKAGKVYDEVWSASLSGDGEHVAYGACDEGGRCMVSDGVETREWDDLRWVEITEIGNKPFYWASKGGRFRLVIGEAKGPEFDDWAWQGLVEFTRDEKRWAYVGRRKERQVLVVDGVEQGEYKAVRVPDFSRDGKRMAYSFKEGDKWRMVVDGKKGKALWDFCQYGVFSDDGKHFVYVASLAGRYSVIKDGKKIGEYAGAWRPMFSPDGKRLAYTIQKGLGMALVVDGVEGPTLPGLKSVDFSPDGKHVWTRAFTAWGWRWDEHGEFHAETGDEERQGEECLLVDGMRGKGYDSVQPSGGFTKDSRHLYYAAEREKKRFAVVDGVEGPRHERVYLPDGGETEKGTLRYVVQDGEEVWLVEVAWPEGLDWRNGMVEIEKK